MAPRRQTTRDQQREETRQRVFDAAIDEFKIEGLAGADVGAIVKAAGVARGTFYFHYATKEHVLAELERQEAQRIADDLARFLAQPHDLRSSFTEVVRLVSASERRLGPVLFRDLLSLHFLPNRPQIDSWSAHPVITLVTGELEAAKQRGEVYSEADAEHSGLFFLLGLYALLTTAHGSKAVRATMLEKFVDTVMRSLVPH